jgi:hypothetical protein
VRPPVATPAALAVSVTDRDSPSNTLSELEMVGFANEEPVLARRSGGGDGVAGVATTHEPVLARRKAEDGRAKPCAVSLALPPSHRGLPADRFLNDPGAEPEGEAGIEAA